MTVSVELFSEEENPEEETNPDEESIGKYKRLFCGRNFRKIFWNVFLEGAVYIKKIRWFGID